MRDCAALTPGAPQDLEPLLQRLQRELEEGQGLQLPAEGASEVRRRPLAGLRGAGLRELLDWLYGALAAEAGGR
jgi:hypothetical protein